MVYWTMDYFKVLYNQFQTSGQTVRAFCKEQGIHEARFYFWVKKLKDNVVTTLEQTNGFIPITPQVVSSISKPVVSSASSPSKSITWSKQRITLTYPNGVIIQIDNLDDLSVLKQLITLV